MDPYDNQRFALRINVSIVQTDERGCYTGNQLEINDRAELKCDSFLEVAKVLGKFHDLAEIIKREAANANALND